MTPREFLVDVVRPNVNAFHGETANVRHAYNAISAIDALAAHFYAWAVSNAPEAVVGKKCDTDYRNGLATSNQKFGLLRDIAKAQKHVRITRGNPSVRCADQLSSRPITYDGAAKYDGEFRHGVQMVVDMNGTITSVEGIVDGALAILESELCRFGA